MNTITAVAVTEDPEPDFSIETVSPQIAASWLQTNVENRKISPGMVRAYAGDMLRGEWMFNGETIKFDTDDNLLDGQHRLHAIIHADVTLRLGVFRNLPREAFKTIDIGKKRGHSDVVGIHATTLGMQILYATAIATTLRYVFFYKTSQWTENKPGRFGRMTNTQLEQLLREFSDIFEVAPRVMKQPLYCNLIPQSQNVFCYYMMQRIDKKAADAFMCHLGSDRPTITRTTNAAQQLQNRLFSTNGEFVPPSPPIKLAWMIKGWNAYLNDRRIDRFHRIIRSLPRFDPNPLDN